MHPEVSKARATVSAFARCVKNGEREANDPVIVQAKTNLAVANIAAYVEKVLSAAPPLTDEQKDRIAGLLRAGGDVA
jgi:fructose-specific phosphotransferase system component IIB